MLLVKPPNSTDLVNIIDGLLAGELSRVEVLSWQQAVFASCAWNVPIDVIDGYWYFYSMMYAATPYPHETEPYFLRHRDFEEYRLDVLQQSGASMGGDMKHLRSHQVDQSEIRWPLAIINDLQDLMAKLPGVRGVFERHLDMLEHCHLQFMGSNYLLVKQFDEMNSRVMLLGNNRDNAVVTQLMRVLDVRDYT